MDFVAVLDQVIVLLRQRGRMTYRALQRQFQLDDDALHDLKDELLYAHREVRDDGGCGLVWTGDAGTAPAATAAPVEPLGQAPLAYTPPYLAEKIRTSRSALEGERKQVTVLFADLKDSTELIRGLDPEAAQQLLDPALHCMMDAVHRFEGTVNQVLGDGIMALFGAPIAHEDHALRACYAALAMQAAMRAYTDEVGHTRGLELRMRVGLNSGEVVVRAIGNDLHMDYSAVGETTVLAARMEQTAMPGSVRLSAATLRLVEGLVQVTALGPVPVKGLEQPVEVFELVRASSVRRRLQAAAARGLTPFVGRQQELEALHQALAWAQTGHGQLVALVGDAGVGKSRLVYECGHSHRIQGWRVLESASVSYGKATPYFPVTDLLRRYCHLDERDDPRTVRAKVTGQVLTLDEALHDTLPPLLSLLEVLPEDSPFRSLDAPQRRQRTLDALKRVLLRESQVQPLLLVFEDLHWIDTETQALLDRLVESVPTAQLLLLVNYRPEYQHGWRSKTYYTQLRLDPLPPASAEAFLAALLGDDPSLARLTPLLIARTEGNPFFLEESVRTLVETQVLVGERGAYALAQPLATLQVPATVQAVLAARIDRLPPEDKRLLQTAAVIGTEVPMPVLQAIAELPEDAVQRGLAHLQAAEFLYETRLFPEHEYTFKHALTHEVAYGSLLLERRRALHARIVEAIEALAPERVAEQVERLAHHALRGEVWDKTVAYCRQAGDKAMARSAYQEALASFEQALVALRYLPESRDTFKQAVELRFHMSNVLFSLGEFARVLNILSEAAPLAEILEDRRQEGRVASLMTEYFWMMGDNDRAAMSGQRALSLANTIGDFVLQVRTQCFLGQTYHTLGDYPLALDVLSRTVVALEGELISKRLGMPFLPAVFSRTWIVFCQSELGAFAEGSTCAAEAVRIAEEVDHPFSRVAAYVGVGHLALGNMDCSRAIPQLVQGLALCRLWHFPIWLPWITSLLGALYAAVGRLMEALPLLEEAVERATAMRLMAWQALWATRLSEAYLHASRIEEAMARAVQALELSRTHKERGHEANVLRLLGAIAARREPPDVAHAEAHYQQALALAEPLGMRPLQAHCHRGLGMLYAATGQQEQARTALSTAIEMYQSMDMTFWLPQTEAALAQVEEQ